jgi:hypothetical protein
MIAIILIWMMCIIQMSPTESSEALVDELSANVKASLHDDLNLLYPGIEEQFNIAAVS